MRCFFAWTAACEGKVTRAGGSDEHVDAFAFVDCEHVGYCEAHARAEGVRARWDGRIRYVSSGAPAFGRRGVANASNLANAA